jgi:hypothetical protein
MMKITTSFLMRNAYIKIAIKNMINFNPENATNFPTNVLGFDEDLIKT